MSPRLPDRPAVLSPAQNSPWRTRISEPFSQRIDRMFDQSLSANDISRLGTRLVMEGVDSLYDSSYPILTPRRTARALRAYGKGLLADVADGIRARKTGGSPEGQLVDVTADRSKEFYQLYIRGISRLKKHPIDGLTTLAAAHAVILPSIARAEAEMRGEVVEENAKGAMFWRTRKLAGSLLEDRLLARRTASTIIDEEILQVSLQIYQERSNGKPVAFPDKVTASPLQKKAVERWLQLVQLFQEEYIVLQQTLSPEQKRAYEAFLQKGRSPENEDGIGKYLTVDVAALREQYAIPDYNLHLPLTKANYPK